MRCYSTVGATNCTVVSEMYNYLLVMDGIRSTHYLRIKSYDGNRVFTGETGLTDQPVFAPVH